MREQRMRARVLVLRIATMSGLLARKARQKGHVQRLLKVAGIRSLEAHGSVGIVLALRRIDARAVGPSRMLTVYLVTIDET